MLKALGEAAGELVSKPAYFIPAFIGAVINAIILLVFSAQYSDIIIDTLLSGDSLNATILEMPFLTFSNYSQQIVLLLVALLVSTVITILVLYCQALVASKKEKSLSKAFSKSLGKTTEIAGFVLFGLLAVFLHMAIAFALFAASILVGTIGIIFFLAFLLWIALGVYFYLKLLFTVLVMAVEGKKLKQALSESWKRTNGKVPVTVLFLVILTIITNIITGVIFFASDLAQIVEISLLLIPTGIAIANSYYNVALTKYFLDFL